MICYSYGVLQVDRCPRCAGLWLDANELEHVLARPSEVTTLDLGVHAGLEHLDSVRRIDCPRDKSHLVQMSDPKQPHVNFEQCSVCGGVFLDAGELRDLADFTLVERLRSMLG